jgi:hypothetical protein
VSVHSVLVCMTMRAMLVLTLGLMACSPTAELPVLGAGLPGRPDRERYLVHLDVAPIDVAAYQQLSDDPAAAKEFADGQRKQLLLKVPGFERALAAIQGSVVERWWMSGAVTIETPKGTAATLQTAPGVRSIRPDQLIAP